MLVSLTGIEDAEGFREAILQQKDKVAEQTRSTAATAAGPSSEQSLEKLTASVERIEALLMSGGILSETNMTIPRKQRLCASFSHRVGSEISSGLWS